MNQFNPKLDKNPVKLSDLHIGQQVLARVRITSRKFIFEPALITTLDISFNSNNYPVLVVERMGGNTSELYIRELDSEHIVIEMKADMNKVIDWKVNEIKKLRAEQHAITAKIKTITTFGEE